MYLTGHQPMLPGHTRRYNFRCRGASAIILPIEGDPVLLTTTPFYEKDLYISNVTYVDDLPAAIGERITQMGLAKADIGIVAMSFAISAPVRRLQTRSRGSYATIFAPV